MSDRNVNDNIMDGKEKLCSEKLDIIKYLVGVVKNEDFISQICVDLSTKRQKTTSEVFLLPGIEGCGTVFNYLASNIEFSATSLLYNNIDTTTNIVSEKTDYLIINHILPKLKDEKDFIIVGYSFGSIIAVELTRRLETMNFKGRLVLIDGAPKQMRKIHEHFASNFSDADLQIFILTNIMEIYSVGSNKK
ncbi:PREDICTED: uncharacterized protein LOC105462008, partial [Wasmannia auropunctata]|uniref:uncharacterized protein LOC105462008 n=1 Tax=Wasmannia auropunctata TaxID=64793 RepID=UPI0005F0AE4F